LAAWDQVRTYGQVRHRVNRTLTSTYAV